MFGSCRENRSRLIVSRIYVNPRETIASGGVFVCSCRTTDDKVLWAVSHRRDEPPRHASFNPQWIVRVTSVLAAEVVAKIKANHRMIIARLRKGPCQVPTKQQFLLPGELWIFSPLWMQHLLHLEMIIFHEKQIYFAPNRHKIATALFLRETIVHNTGHEYNISNIVF